jgi:hypothetical protein
MQFASFATLFLLFAVASNAVRVYREGNTKVPVTGTEAKVKDFGELENGEFVPRE